MDNLNKYYVLLLIIHGLHLIEEVFGSASFVEFVYGGIKNFLIINISLLIIPAILFYFVLKREKIALYLAFAYSLIMIIDGLDHIIEFFLQGAYFGGAAGFFTGLLFLPVSIFLIIEIKQVIHKNK